MTPSIINLFLIASTVYSFMTIAVSTYAVIIKELVYAPTFYKFNMVFLIAFIIQLILVILFSNKSVQTKFHKIQVWILPIIGFKMTIDLYMTYFFLCIDHKAPGIMFTLGLIMLTLGVILHILCTIRIFRNAKFGAFRRDRKNLEENKNRDNKWLIIIVAVIAVALLRRLLRSFELFGISFDLIFILLIGVLIQYIFLFVFPKLFLLAYYKQRFS